MSEAAPRRFGPVSFLLLALIAAGTIALGLWAFAASHDRIDIVIPAGTSDQIASRQTLTVIDDPLTANLGDTLVLTNRDDRMHTFDGATIAPGDTVEIKLDGTRDSVVASSVGNNGEVRLIVK